MFPSPPPAFAVSPSAPPLTAFASEGVQGVCGSPDECLALMVFGISTRLWGLGAPVGPPPPAGNSGAGHWHTGHSPLVGFLFPRGTRLQMPE